MDHVSFLSINYLIYHLTIDYLSSIRPISLSLSRSSILIYQIGSTLPLSCLGSPPRNNLKHLPSSEFSTRRQPFPAFPSQPSSPSHPHPSIHLSSSSGRSPGYSSSPGSPVRDARDRLTILPFLPSSPFSYFPCTTPCVVSTKSGCAFHPPTLLPTTPPFRFFVAAIFPSSPFPSSIVNERESCGPEIQ